MPAVPTEPPRGRVCAWDDTECCPSKARDLHHGALREHSRELGRRRKAECVRTHVAEALSRRYSTALPFHSCTATAETQHSSSPEMGHHKAAPLRCELARPRVHLSVGTYAPLQTFSFAQRMLGPHCPPLSCHSTPSSGVHPTTAEPGAEPCRAARAAGSAHSNPSALCKDPTVVRGLPQNSANYDAQPVVRKNKTLFFFICAFPVTFFTLTIIKALLRDASRWPHDAQHLLLSSISLHPKSNNPSPSLNLPNLARGFRNRVQQTQNSWSLPGCVMKPLLTGEGQQTVRCLNTFVPLTSINERAGAECLPWELLCSARSLGLFAAG